MASNLLPHTTGQHGCLLLMLLLGVSLFAPPPARGQERVPDYTYIYSGGQAANGRLSASGAVASGAAAFTPGELSAINALGLEEEDVASISLIGDAAGYGVFTTAASSFPQEGNEYLVFGSGAVASALTANTSGSTSGDLGGAVAPGGGNDMVRMVIELNVPAGATKVSFNFKFFSEEYPEWVNSAYNDGFIVEAGSSTFHVSGNDVVAPDNLVFDQNGVPITINTTGNLGMTGGNAAGTTYDGATPVLSTEIPIEAGATTITLIFSIFDVGDDIYDSTVFLDNFEFDRIDLELVALEVNQAVQDWHNSVPLVKDKKTVVRAYVQSQTAEEGSAENVRLKGTRDGAVLGELPALNGVTFRAAAQTNNDVILTGRRKDLSKSLNFQLPAAWLDGTVELELVRSGGELDCAPAVATGADCATTVTFNAPDRPKVEFVRVSRTVGTTTNEPTEADVIELVQRARAIMPVADLTWDSRLYTWPSATAFTLQNVNLHLEMMHFLDCWLLGTCDRLYYGVLRTPTDMGGLANGIPGTVASGTMPTSAGAYGRNRHVHEIGHDIGLEHVTYCGAVAGTAPAFPANYTVNVGGITRATLGPMDMGIQHEVWGLDSHQDVPVDPREHFELLSYCGTGANPWRWISKFSYENFRQDAHNKFPASSMRRPGPLLSSLTLLPNAEQEYLILQGSINPETNEVEFTELLTVKSDVPPPPIPTGPYTAQVVDENGGVLSDIRFNPLYAHTDLPAEIENYGTFIMAIPLHQDAHGVEVTDEVTTLQKVTKSPNTPVVTVVFPNGGETLNASPVTLQWTASDADGDVLSYTVQYSTDGGATWKTLAVGWPDTSLEVPLSLLEETTQGVIRVLASDGFNTGQDTSDDVFTTPNSAPDAYILQPGDDGRFIGTEPLYFDGIGYDPEDGNLAGGSLTWESNLDGFIDTGNGFFVQANALTEGVHTIMLTATDASGETGTASVQVEVLHQAPPETGVDDNCPTSLVISAFRTQPGAQEYVDLKNVGTGTVSLERCVLAGFNGYTSTSYVGLTASGTLAPGEAFRFGASLAPGVDEAIPNNSLQDRYGAFALLNRTSLPNGSSIADVQPDIVTSMIYLTSGTVYGFFHIDTSIQPQYCSLYAGKLHPYAQQQCAALSTASKTVPGPAAGPAAQLQAMMAEAPAEATDLPVQYALEQNYPNPFNPSTEVRFELPSEGHVRLVVFDVLGREVVRVIDAPMDAGRHRVVLDLTHLPSGTYLYRLEAGTFAQTRRMVFLK